jgi:hypothetical protein
MIKNLLQWFRPRVEEALREERPVMLSREEAKEILREMDAAKDREPEEIKMCAMCQTGITHFDEGASLNDLNFHNEDCLRSYKASHNL